MEEKKTTRQSNFELLRIIAMIMIVAHHFAYRSEMVFDTSTITAGRLWQQFLMYGGHIGLDVFVLISGYFLVDRTRLNLSKIARIWIMMFFYSVVIYAAIIATGTEVAFLDLYSDWVLIPACTGVWDFASAYLGLMFAFPFINLLLHALSKNQYRLIIAVMLIFWSVLPTFFAKSFGCNYFLWLVALYTFAGYIKLYPEDFARGKSFYRKWMFILWGLSLASAVVLDVLGFKFEICATYATHFSGMQHINIVLTAICMFLTFKEVKIGKKDGNSRIVNLVASATFGVYLIHDNLLLSQWIWKQLFKNAEYTDKWWFIPASVGEILLVFAVCMVIELLRQNLLEKYYMKGVEKILSRPQAFIDRLMKQ